MSNVIELRLPANLRFSKQHISEMQNKNQHLTIRNTRGGCKLLIEAKNFSFSDVDEVELFLPSSMSFNSETIWESFSAKNELKIEANNEKIFIHMGNFRNIGAFTARIISKLCFWNEQKNFGQVYSETTDFLLSNNKIREADAALISFKKLVYSKVSNYVVGSPNLCVEIVANEKSISHNLTKMQEDWVNSGTEVGLVVCPCVKKYYLFENTNSQEISFSVAFSHSLFPDLSLNFDELWEKALQF